MWLFAATRVANLMNTIPRKSAAVTVSLLVVSILSFAHDAHEHDVPASQVGSVTFPISCSNPAQSDVEHGLAMMHSFLFDDAEGRFKAAAEADSGCAMAYWAQAIGLYRVLAYRQSDADMKRGWELVQKAAELKPKTQRERDYIEAAETLYRADERTYATRNHEYSKQLQKIFEAYPDDTEAAVFYALSLITWADSEHPVKDSEKAMAILNPIFAKHPDHPGIAHYIIHATDTPPLAAQGLDAARHYAQIAPAAPHALHMPSHIFARLGLWQEDIQSNLASLHAAQDPTLHVGAEHQLHAMEFLEYAYLQIGEDEKAKQMVDAGTKISYDQVDPNLHDYVDRTRANSPAMFFLEIRSWKAAQDLKPDPGAAPYNQAITFWAHAVAAGHLHDSAATKQAIDQYDAMLEATQNGPRPFVAKRMATQHDEAHAWLVFLQGKGDEAAKMLRAVAEKQDTEGKGEVEPPAREMLADMLLEMNRPAGALAEFEKSLKSDPNRFDGLYGAGRAAELLGEHEKAQRYYAQLMKNCKASQLQRLELAHASESIGANR